MSFRTITPVLEAVSARISKDARLIVLVLERRPSWRWERYIPLSKRGAIQRYARRATGRFRLVAGVVSPASFVARC